MSTISPVSAYIRAAAFGGGCIGVIIFAFIYFEIPQLETGGSSAAVSLAYFPAFLFGAMIIGPLLLAPVGGLTAILGRVWRVNAPSFYSLGGSVAALFGVFAPLYFSNALTGGQLVAFFTEPARMVWPVLIAIAGALFGYRYAQATC